MRNRARAVCNWGVARRLLLFVAGATAFGVIAAPAASAQAQQNVVQVAQGDPRFSTLVRATQTAGLVETLSGPGPFTVFAPTNDAFNKLPAGTLDSLLQNQEQLRAVLTYHVVPGRATAADVQGRPSANTVQGAPINFNASGGTVRANNATVIQADVGASNGVIHAIDTVLLPPGVQVGGAPQAAAQPGQLPRAGEADAAAPTTVVAFGLALLALGALLVLGGPALARARRGTK
jgi:uncharacterized surface protein with fasciclin (FAS1) repeats